MQEKYDVVIIGAGIGGLVCGCYLAKAGLKVLIVEQQSKPGGYCTSFERDGYRFDVAVRYLASIKKGILRRILEELNLLRELKIIQSDPAEKIVMPKNTICIRANFFETKEDFKRNFSKETKRIEDFFRFIFKKDFSKIYPKIKKWPFEKVLNEFSFSYKLKSLINAIVLINTGLPIDKIAAVSGVILFRVYIKDPGYYPVGGIQCFADALANKFKYYNGKLFLNKKVERIICKNNKVRGVILCDDREEIQSRVVVSNIDASQLFKKILTFKSKESTILKKLKPSPSMFVVYTGINISSKIKEVLKTISGSCYFFAYDMKKQSSFEENIIKGNLNGLICEVPSLRDSFSLNKNNCAVIFAISAPYNSKKFWNSYKEELYKKMINKIQNLIFPIKKYLNVKIIATPVTFYKYTSNKKGAAFGWASTLNQIKISLLPPRTSIENLYLTGHWCTIGFGQGGIPGVALSGRKTAELILTDIGKKWKYGLMTIDGK